MPDEPDVQKAVAEFDQAHRIEERFVKDFEKILYQNADGLGGEVKWDGEKAEVIALR
jgi:hypothetical protein